MTPPGHGSDCPAALRLPVLGGRRFSVGRIRHVCRHPAQPRVQRLTARRRCACWAYGVGSRRLPQERRPDKACMPPSGTTAGTVPDRPAALRLRGPGGGIPQASSVVARLSVAPAGNAPSTTLSHQNHASNIPPTFSESSCWSWVPFTFAVCSLSTWPPVT